MYILTVRDTVILIIYIYPSIQPSVLVINWSCLTEGGDLFQIQDPYLPTHFLKTRLKNVSLLPVPSIALRLHFFPPSSDILTYNELQILFTRFICPLLAK